MGPVQAIMSSVMTIFFYAMVIAAVWKLFQVGADLGEIKQILSDIRSNVTNPAKPMPVAAVIPAPPPILAGPISLESAEALLREVAAESHALAAAEPPKTTA